MEWPTQVCHEWIQVSWKWNGNEHSGNQVQSCDNKPRWVTQYVHGPGSEPSPSVLCSRVWTANRSWMGVVVPCTEFRQEMTAETEVQGLKLSTDYTCASLSRSWWVELTWFWLSLFFLSVIVQWHATRSKGTDMRSFQHRLKDKFGASACAGRCAKCKRDCILCGGGGGVSIYCFGSAAEISCYYSFFFCSVYASLRTLK